MEAIEQSNSTVPGGILVDALPYIDHGPIFLQTLLLKSHLKNSLTNSLST